MADLRTKTRVKRSMNDIRSETTREMLGAGRGPLKQNLAMADPNYKEPQYETRMQKAKRMMYKDAFGLKKETPSVRKRRTAK